MYICIIINSDRIYKLRFYLRLYSGILFENDTLFIRYAYSQIALFFSHNNRGRDFFGRIQKNSL